QIYTLSLHDALPIYQGGLARQSGPRSSPPHELLRRWEHEVLWSRALSAEEGRLRRDSAPRWDVSSMAQRARLHRTSCSHRRNNRSEEHTSELQSLTN